MEGDIGGKLGLKRLKLDQRLCLRILVRLVVINNDTRGIAAGAHDGLC